MSVLMDITGETIVAWCAPAPARVWGDYTIKVLL